MYLHINNILWLAIFFILGAIFGSFFNVCIYRIPRKRSIISPRSYCPMCEHTIPWYDNIPIISYISLRGKCRFCGATIPVRYLIVELLTACMFSSCFYIFGIGLKLLVTLILLSFLLVTAFIDIEMGIIPNIIVLPGMAIGVILNTVQGKIINSLLGLLTGGITVYILSVIGKILFKKDAIGGGDMKLLAMIGAYIGWYLTLWTLFLASLIGLIYAIFSRKRKLMFAPFLAIATFILLVLRHP